MRNLKKVILVFGLCLFVSCGKDSEEVPVSYTYTINTYSDCPKGSKSIAGNYEITKETYDKIKPNYQSAGGCYYWATFKDVTNVSRKGYVYGLGYYN
jgi:hypothetical protein